MCAIAGIYNFKSLEPVSPRLIKAMTDTMVYRGPDDEVSYCSGPVGLAIGGFRSLTLPAGISRWQTKMRVFG